MAEMRGLAGMDTFAMPKVTTGHVLLYPNPDWGFRVFCDFEEDTSQGRLAIFDNDSSVEIFAPVRQMVPALEEALAAFKARLAELPE